MMDSISYGAMNLRESCLEMGFQRNATRGEPNLLSGVILRCLGPFKVSSLAVFFNGAMKGGGSTGPDEHSAADVVTDRGDRVSI